MISNKLLNALFFVLDLVEDVVAAVQRLRGRAPAEDLYRAAPSDPHSAAVSLAPDHGPELEPPPEPEADHQPAEQAPTRPAPAARRRTAAAKKPAAKRRTPAAARRARPAKAPVAEADQDEDRMLDQAAGAGADTAPKAGRARRQGTMPPAAQQRQDAMGPLLEALREGRVTPPAADATVADSAPLARLVWALHHARTWLGRGLSGAEAAELITAAGTRTEATNVLRAVRADGGRLFGKESGGGRAAFIILTADGQAQANEVFGPSARD